MLMSLDFVKCLHCCNSSQPVTIGKASDRRFNVESASVGGLITAIPKRTIPQIFPDAARCPGLGEPIAGQKSTFVGSGLADRAFQIASFGSCEVTDRADLNDTDRGLAIAAEKIESLALRKIALQPGYCFRLLAHQTDVLQPPLDRWGNAELWVEGGKMSEKIKQTLQWRYQVRDFRKARTEEMWKSIAPES